MKIIGLIRIWMIMFSKMFHCLYSTHDRNPLTCHSLCLCHSSVTLLLCRRCLESSFDYCTLEMRIKHSCYTLRTNSVCRIWLNKYNFVLPERALVFIWNLYCSGVFVPLQTHRWPGVSVTAGWILTGCVVGMCVTAWALASLLEVMQGVYLMSNFTDKHNVTHSRVSQKRRWRLSLMNYDLKFLWTSWNEIQTLKSAKISSLTLCTAG